MEELNSDNDGYCLGPAENAFAALETFEQEIKDNYCLHLARETSEVF